MDEKIEKLKDWIAGSDNIVFFGRRRCARFGFAPSTTSFSWWKR